MHNLDKEHPLPSYLTIVGDPTKWWLDQPIDSSMLTGQPLSVPVLAPLAGTLLVSPRAASVAIAHLALSGFVPTALDVPAPTIYVPTVTGPLAGSVGYELPASVSLPSLASETTALMLNGGKQSIPLGGGAYTGALVLNGATLSFVVLCPGGTDQPSGGGPVPSD
jgi:hypothetical protein